MVKDRSKIKGVEVELTYLVDVEVTCSVGISQLLSSHLDKIEILKLKTSPKFIFCIGQNPLELIHGPFIFFKKVSIFKIKKFIKQTKVKSFQVLILAASSF